MSEPCENCPANVHLAQMGLKLDKFDRVVAWRATPIPENRPCLTR